MTSVCCGGTTLAQPATVRARRAGPAARRTIAGGRRRADRAIIGPLRFEIRQAVTPGIRRLREAAPSIPAGRIAPEPGALPHRPGAGSRGAGPSGLVSCSGRRGGERTGRRNPARSAAGRAARRRPGTARPRKTLAQAASAATDEGSLRALRRAPIPGDCGRRSSSHGSRRGGCALRSGSRRSHPERSGSRIRPGVRSRGLRS